MADLFLLRNNEIIDLFEIKINDYEGYFRFHGSKNFDKDIIFKNQTYLYIPCEISNLEYNSEGKQNRPTLVISNVNNFITNFIKDRNDLLGCRIFKKKILAKDLDNINFGGEDKNPLGQNTFTSYISNDTFIIQKKNYEQKDKVEFVLANVLDVDGLTVPTRKVYNDTCQWQYRGCGCNYGKILNYDGPSVVLKQFPITTLEAANDKTSMGANLVGWFKDGASQTFTGTIKSPDYYNPTIKKTFDKLTAWTTSAGAATMTLTSNPKKYTNQYGKVGILFTYDRDLNAWDKMQINLDFQTSPNDCTIFYVGHMSNVLFTKVTNGAPYGGYPRRGLTTNAASGNNFLLGFWKNYEDLFYVNNWVTPAGGKSAWQTINVNRVYAAVLPQSTANQTVFYRDGNEILRKTGFGGKPKNFGINLANNEESEIVIYEVIVYNKVLTSEEVQNVSTYLAYKYKTPIAYTKIATETRTSKSYFDNTDEGNLGVPMADENNKIFLKSQQSFAYTNYESYGLEELNYKGDYDSTIKYVKGDFVKIDPSLDFDFNEKAISNNFELPSKFFVCVASEAINQHPFSYTNIWKEDKCSKTLNGCSLRFNNSIVNIPFGGFPGTVGYDYRLPG